MYHGWLYLIFLIFSGYFIRILPVLINILQTGGGWGVGCVAEGGAGRPSPMLVLRTLKEIILAGINKKLLRIWVKVATLIPARFKKLPIFRTFEYLMYRKPRQKCVEHR